jgi:hypothetical protein
MKLLNNQIKEQSIRVHDQSVLITKKTIKKTVNWYVKNAIGCIREAQSGDVFVNDFEDYRLQNIAKIKEYRSGNFEMWLGFWQQAYFIQCGESVPILN